LKEGKFQEKHEKKPAAPVEMPEWPGDTHSAVDEMEFAGTVANVKGQLDNCLLQLLHSERHAVAAIGAWLERVVLAEVKTTSISHSSGHIPKFIDKQSNILLLSN
jgi:hypothetical protein